MEEISIIRLSFSCHDSALDTKESIHQIQISVHITATIKVYSDSVGRCS